MKLDDLARSVAAYEAVDISEFQRSARILQSLWREEQGFEVGEHNGRLLGSRLRMPWAQDELANFITPTIREIVRDEVLDNARSTGKLYGKPRIFNDLLSSQPLCFNLFGELSRDLDLASRVICELTSGRFDRVTSVDFEYSPGRGDLDYLDDRSAFDIFVRCSTAARRSGFVGIEVKYHENLLGLPGKHKPRYDEVADQMGCFVKDRTKLKQAPLQQIWRDHLLAGITLIQDRYDDGMFVTLYPADNPHVSKALGDYRTQLTSCSSFDTWTLELFVSRLRDHTKAAWVDAFENRYLSFDKIKRILNGEN